MKTSIFSILLLALFSFVLISCKDKDKDKEPEPDTTAETNYVTIDGTKYKLNTTIEEMNGNLYFYSNVVGVALPNMTLTFKNKTKPTSTATYSGILDINQNNSEEDMYTVTTDFTIEVKNGTYSISFPATTFKNSKNEEVKASGNITAQ